MQETWVQSLGQQDPLEKEMAAHSRILAWRILTGYSPWGCKRVRHDSGTKQPQYMGSEVKASASNAGDPDSIPGPEDPLEKKMAIHSSILAWRIP